jgi:hypothetical protein
MKPLHFPRGGIGPYGESCLIPESSFTCLLYSSINALLVEKNFIPSLEGPRRGTSPQVYQNGASMKTDAHFQSIT